ncbi:MAG: TonB-dependent receptor [Bryobacteraceae bacterium]
MRIGKLLLLSLLGIAAALAQGNRGSITGTVTDPAGAVIAGVAVEGKGLETGALYETVTTDTGNFTLAELPPGIFEVTFTAPGFKKYIRGPVEVGARQTLRIDGALEVGTAAESITVTAAATLLVTESAEISYNVTTNRLQDLPVGNMGSVRNAIRQAAQLMPGVNFTPGGFGGVKINGAPVDAYNLRIDGMDNTYTLGNLLVTQVQPSVEAIEQYSIQTSNFAAELGQAGGSIFNVSMKSGTNQFHGSIYDFWAKDTLYAASPQINPATGTKTKNPVSNYDYGFTVGGPIKIPKVYNGANKSFFFFSYETRPSTGQNLNSFVTVPTDAYRVGDLSAATALNNNRVLGTDPAGRSIIQNSVYDPQSNFTNAAGQVLRNAFVGNQIPVARFDPVSVKILALVPKANVATAGLLNNYNNPFDTATKNYLPSFKLDHNINSNHKLNFFYSRTWQNQPISTAEGLPTLISNGTLSLWRNTNIRLNYDATLTPTILLHLGAGYQEASIGQVNFPQTNRYNVTKELGIQGPFTTNLEGSTFPDFNGATSGTTGGLPQLGNTSFNGRTDTRNQRPTGIATLTWVKSNHTYKFGGEVRIEGYPNYNEIRLNGTYSFSGDQTALPYNNSATFAGNTVGLGYASFLLGLTNNTSVSLPTNPHLGNHSLGFYAQDTWKISRKLTVDYGLRWDYATYRTETYGRQATLDPLKPNASAGGQPGATRWQSTCNCQWSNNYPHSWGPRLGAAYQINSKTVLRGGIGLMYNTTPRVGIAGRSSPANSVVPQSFGFESIKLVNGIPLTVNDIRWPNYDPNFFPIRASSPGAANGSVFDQNAGRPARQLQFSIGLQREIFRDLVIEASYVGNVGVWWTGNGLVNYNAVQFDTLAARGIDITKTADAELLRSNLNTAAVVARGYRAPFTGFPSNVSLFQSLRPFPQFNSGLAAVDAPLNTTWYNSLQSKITKRFSHGIDATYAFTYQKSMTASNIQDVFNRKTGRGLDSADQRLQSVIAFTYTVPKMRGINRALAYALYDWQVGAILTYASGLPIAAPAAQNLLANAIGQGANAIRVPGVPLFLQDLNSGNVDPRRGFYLNPAAWTQPVAGQFGGPLTYGDYRSQRQPNEAMNFGRNFRISERVSAQARVEFTNIFNRMRPNAPSSGNALTPQVLATSNAAVATGFGAISWQNTAGQRNGQMVFRLTF